MDTYRWADGVSVTMAKAFKRGFFSCYFPLFLPSDEEQDYLGGRTLLGISKWGLGCSQKMGHIGFGVGRGQNIARTKCGIGCGVGSVFFLSFFPLLQNRLCWDLSDWIDRVFIVKILSTLFSTFPHLSGLSPAKHETKKALVSKEWARCNW
jgi:hypothetical protein